MSSEKNNNVAFRLPADHFRELTRLAAEHGQSKGRLAKNIVTAALLDFSRFDEIDHRLQVIDRILAHLVETLGRLDDLRVATDQLRAASAAATSRLLIDVAHVDLEEAVAWTKETFAVSEEP